MARFTMRSRAHFPHGNVVMGKMAMFLNGISKVLGIRIRLGGPVFSGSRRFS